MYQPAINNAAIAIVPISSTGKPSRLMRRYIKGRCSPTYTVHTNRKKVDTMTRYNKDFEELMALQFAIVELNLFLDTHPDDEQALRDYNRLVEQFEMAKKAYTEKYGPLVNFGYGKSKHPWQWVNEPWPWDR